MNVIRKIRIKLKEIKYLRYIDNHRMNIDLAFDEMVQNQAMQEWFTWTEDFCCKLKERVLTHDISKYEDEEFNAYRRYYHPIDKFEKILAINDFNKAWEHHWKNNRHHWQARQEDPELEHLDEDTALDCLENVLDWMAMGYQFHDRPYQFYEKHKNEIKLPKCQKDFIEKVIYEGIDKGAK